VDAQIQYLLLHGICEIPLEIPYQKISECTKLCPPSRPLVARPTPPPNHHDLLKILELLYKTPLQEVELLFIFEDHIHNHCICVYV
jgi:hypothetical protein